MDCVGRTSDKRVAKLSWPSPVLPLDRRRERRCEASSDSSHSIAYEYRYKGVLAREINLGLTVGGCVAGPAGFGLRCSTVGLFLLH